MPTEISDNILGVLWSKLTYTCLGYYGSLADASLAASCADESGRRNLTDFLTEVVSVGKAANVRFIPLAEYNPLDFDPARPFDQRLAALNAFAASWQKSDRKGPLRQIRGALKTEVDFTLGYAVDAAEERKIPTPLCRKVWSMIRELETGTRKLGMPNYLELQSTG